MINTIDTNSFVKLTQLILGTQNAWAYQQWAQA